MIVRDEAVSLSACLESVRDLVDEMVVVDTGSTDETVEIARSFGAHVHGFEWRDDFAAARNAALQRVTADWVLVLDGDETLVAEVIPAIRQIMQQETILAVNLLRQEVGTMQPPSLVSRLFRCHPDIHFFRPYHELIDDSVLAIVQCQPSWQVVELAGIAIRHTGYQASAIAQRQKGDRARRIMAAYLNQHPQDAYICNKLGALYVEQGEVEKGLELLHQGLRHAQEPAVLCELHTHLGSVYQQVQNFPQAETHYRQAIAQPVSPRLRLAAWHNLGQLLQEKGDWLTARSLYQQMVDSDPTFAPGYFNLGVVSKTLGDLPGAIALYRQAIARHPTYAEAYQNLGVALLKLGQVPDSLHAFRRAIALYRQHHSPEGDRLEQALQSMGLPGW